MMTTKEVKALINSVIALRASVSDEQAVTMLNIFPVWRTGRSYAANDRVVFEGALYRVLVDHEACEDMTPEVATDLYTKI